MHAIIKIQMMPYVNSGIDSVRFATLGSAIASSVIYERGEFSSTH